MHCAICDREDDLISFDKETKEFSPCTVCQTVIEETLNGYEDIKAENNTEMDNTGG